MRRENAESSQELAQTVASGNAMRGQAGRAVEEAHIVGLGEKRAFLKNRGEMQRLGPSWAGYDGRVEPRHSCARGHGLTPRRPATLVRLGLAE